MPRPYQKKMIHEFATKAHALGFTVYLADSKGYGFLTDDSRSRVLSFECEFGSIKLGGNYKPATGCGSGWDMGLVEWEPTAEKIKAHLYAAAPNWANKSPEYTTPEQYTKGYGSSGYTLFTGE